MAATGVEDVPRHSVHTLVFRSLKRTHDMFLSDYSAIPEPDEAAEKIRAAAKAKSEYGPVIKATQDARRRKEANLALPEVPIPVTVDQTTGAVTAPQKATLMLTDGSTPGSKLTDHKGPSTDLVALSRPKVSTEDSVRALLPRKAPMMAKPIWHAPWKLYRVISGHTGWVRCVDVEPGNEWFASGGADRIIKIWDLASGKLRLSLTGHVSAVRAVKVAPNQPYLFSAGEDKQVKCWDLEYNKVIRHYHGHLSAVQDLSVHPTIDVLVTCARDSTARVWDMRTKAQVHCLSGHTNTVASVVCQAVDPQVITGSHDSTVRLWDLAAGRSVATLTQHKKSIRALTLHPKLYMFASGSPDNIKQWKCPNGEFVQNLTGHNAIINSLACNEDGVLVSGADNGSLQFWDWKSGFCFQKAQTKPQPGSIDSEAGIYALTFDKSGSRLISAEADKSIKMYKEDETATEDTHPVLWRPEILKKKVY
uniref:Pleiotropic regulator 1 n=1 Tax=Plectus sambesii TaxID=2011161 RepID=A0A914X8J0_9BILA